MLASGSSLEEDRGLVGRKGTAGAWADALGDGCGGARLTRGLGMGAEAARSMPSGDARLLCSGGTRPATNKASLKGIGCSCPKREGGDELGNLRP